MKYITTLQKTPSTSTIRIFLDLKSKLFILKVKENKYTATYNALTNCFVDVNFKDLNWAEHMLVHTYFYINKDEFKRIIEQTDSNSLDFVSNNLKMPDVDYNDDNFVFELSKLIDM